MERWKNAESDELAVVIDVYVLQASPGSPGNSQEVQACNID